MTDKTRRYGVPLFLLLAFLIGLDTIALDRARLVTFGPDAGPGKGDDDFRELVSIRVRASVTQPLHLRIFDPDVGGGEDEPTGPWNTRTRFALFGGDADSKGARLLAEAVFGADPRTDGQWHNLGAFSPDQGERVGDDWVFTLVAEGLEGDDGNLFDVAVSADPKTSVQTEGVVLLSLRPTIRIPAGADRVAEVRFAVPPGTTGLSIRSFDLDQARTRLDLPFSDPIPLQDSGDGRWGEDRVSLDAEERAQPAGIVIRGGRKLLNNVVLEARDQSGRPLAFRLPVKLFPRATPPRPVAEFETLSDCRTVVFDASGSHDKESQLIGYHWDFGDGQSGVGQRITHTYAQPGVYQATLTVADDSGRVNDRARRDFRVKVNQAPEAVAGSPQIAAPGEPLLFDARASRDLDGDIIAYRWAFGDGHRGDGARVSHVYTEPGRYQVELRLEDDGPGPCRTALASTGVWINAPPVADAGADRAIAVGETLRLEAAGSRDTDGELRSFHWDLGDGQEARGPIAEHQYGMPGRYGVTLSVEDDAGVGNSRAVDAMIVTVNAPPIAVPDGDRRGAAGEPLAFNAMASQDPDGRLIRYAWDFGDGHQAEGAEVEHSYRDPGSYLVTLRVRDDSGTASETSSAQLEVVVNHPPIADAGPDQRVTASEARFDGRASHDPDGRLVAWQWDFGDGALGQGPNPSHVYAAPGSYTVVLTVTDDSGTASASAQDRMRLVVNAKPIADAGPDRLAVPGENLVFDGSGSFDPDGSIREHRWAFGDGTTGTGATASHAYPRPGRYHVQLQVEDDTGHPGAVGLADVLVQVNAPPIAVAGPDLEIAPGDLVELDAGASYDPDGRILSYQWSFSDGEPSAEGPRARRRFEEPGSFGATLEVVDDSGATNGRARDELAIRVNHQPRAVPGDPIEGCEQWVALDGRASSDADGDPLSFRWAFGDGSPPGDGARPLHRFPAPGRYPVVLTVDDGTGLANATHSASTQVWIQAAPRAVAEAAEIGCAGELILFNGARSEDPDGGRLFYTWDFGDGTQSHAASPAKAYPQGGVYRVKLRVQDDSGLACDLGEDRIAVTVVDAPVADAGGDRRVCANTPVAFDGSGSRDFDGVVNAFSWDFGDGTKGGGPNPRHLYSSAGEYLVTLTIRGDEVGDCDNRHSDRIRVEVLAAPRVGVEAPSQAALGRPVTFRAVPAGAGGEASSAGLGYRWEFGDGASAEGQEVTHGYAEPGRYQVVLTADRGDGGECSRVRLEHPLLVNAPPRAVAGEDRVVAPGETLFFDASASSDPDGAIRDYRWDFGDGETASGVRVSHRYERPGVYVAELEVTDDTSLENNRHRDRLTIRSNAAPNPRFRLEPQVPCVGQEVVLDGTSSDDPDGSISAWQWGFGDGEIGAGERVQHRYLEPGRYQVRLRVTDDSQAPNAHATLVREILVNRPPRAEIAGPIKGCAGASVQFDGSRSQDPEGRIRVYDWSFGEDARAVGRQVSHSFAEPGLYSVVLRVVDDADSACSAGRAVAEVFINGSPKASIRTNPVDPFVGGAHDAILFDATGSTDPNDDPLTYHWDFGDGTRGRGPRVMHAFSEPGRYRVTLEVRDGSGTECSTATDQLELEVKGDPIPESDRLRRISPAAFHDRRPTPPTRAAAPRPPA